MNAPNNLPLARTQKLPTLDRRKAGRVTNVSPLAVGSLMFFFASSGFALVLEEILRNPLVHNAVLIAGPGAMWLVKLQRPQKTTSSRDSRRANTSLLIVACAACLSATAAIFDPALNDRAIQSCVLKTGGLVFIFVTMANCVPLFSAREVRNALVGFALVEGSTVLIASFALGLDLNPNAVGVRVSTCGLLLFASLPNRLARLAGLTVALAIAFILQCRTSMIATIGAIAAGHFEVRTRGARGSLFVVAMLAVLTMAVFGDDFKQSLQDLAAANLRSDNPIARFFLSDKDHSDLSGDYLDRQHVWSAMLRFVEERPFLGYGIGTESALFHVRSHNAYLSLLIEGGAALLVSWLFVYSLFISQTMNPLWTKHFADGAIGKSQVLLFAYLALAALVESSGVGSISTPNNIVFLFLTLWVTAQLAKTSAKTPKRQTPLAVPPTGSGK